MALFKIHKGDSANLDAQSRVEGYCWFTPDTGHFFIDTADARVPINATMYGVCNTAADTATKTVDITGFRLYTGARVTVKFTYASGASNSTLNVNGTGAKNMVRYGTTAIGNSSTLGWAAGAIQTFTYDGTSWVADYWQNTTYSNVALGHGYATCSTAAATAAKTASLSSYALTKGGIVAVKFTYAVPANATLNINSKGAKNIYYRGAKIVAGIINAGDTAIFMYDGTQYQFLAKDYNNATTTTAGLMSAADKAKLDGIASGATANTGDITGVTAGVGLAGGATSGSATVKAKLRSETALTIDSAAATTTTGRVYPVAVDKTGYLAVNVPWTDTNTDTDTGATSVEVTGTGSAVTAASYDAATRKLTLTKGSTFNNYSLPVAKYNTLGGVKPAYSSTGAAVLTTTAATNTSTPTIAARTTTAGRYYAVEVDKNGVAFVNVPWSDTDTNTTYSAGTGLTLNTSNNQFYVTSANVSTMMNLLGEGTSPAELNDYLIAQYAGGGTTTTTYYRRKVSNVVNATVVKAALGTGTGTTKYLREDGQWIKPPNTTYDPATQSANGLMSKDDKFKLDNTNVAYGTCDTAEATAAKVVTLSGNTQWKLTNGAIIMVKFTNTNSASSVTLNVNSTGAYPIWYSNAEYTSAGTAYTGYAGRTITYMFNGTHWVWISGSYDANTQSNTNSTNTSSKIYLIGATSQGSNKTTYSHDTVYVDANGNVNTPKLIVNTTDTPGIKMNRGSYNYIQGGDSAPICLIANDVVGLANASLIAAKTAVHPGANNTFTLGTSDYKWKNVYATTFTGALTGDVTGNVSGSSGSCTGNAATATKLKTAFTLSLAGAADDSVTIDGSANRTLTIADVKESYLSWGGKNINGGVSPVGAALSAEHSANRLAYFNAAGITVETSNDGGSTWTTASTSDADKVKLVTTSTAITVGTASTVTTNHRTRITFTAQNGTTGYMYTRPRKLLLDVSTPHGLSVTLEAKKGTSGAAWETLGTYTISGWSGWNDIPLSIATIGGGTNQTSNYWYFRLTYANTSVNSSYTTTKSTICAIRLFGDTCWTKTSNMGETGHLYAYDENQNATFPAEITSSNNFVLNGATTNRGFVVQHNGYWIGKLIHATIGSTSAGGNCQLVLGNNRTNTSDYNARGSIMMYSPQTTAVTILAHTIDTNYQYYFRNHNQTVYSVGTTTRSAVGEASVPVYVNSNGIITACTSISADAASKDGEGNIIIDTYLKLTGGTVSGEVNSSATVATTSAAFRNIKVIAPGTEVVAGTTAIPTGEIWVRYEE